METFDEFERRINSEGAVVTGYPHLDRMWEAKYDPKFLNLKLPKCSLNEYLTKQTSTYGDLTAINYFGNKISYNELQEKIDVSSKALKAIEIGYDDRVMYLMPNIPETAYLMYGTSKIGGIADFIDPRPDSIDMSISAKKILMLARNEKIKTIVALDQCYLAMIKPIEAQLKEIGINNIVVVSASDSMNLPATINYLKENVDMMGFNALRKKLKKSKEIENLVEQAMATSCLNVIHYRDLINDSRYIGYKEVPYISGKIDIITHTSGTSGSLPKPIPLSNDNLNQYVHQTYGANMNMGTGDKGLHILPYFAAFGVVNVLHAGLCRGWELMEVPEFSPSQLGKILVKYKPQIIIGPPTWFLNFPNDPNLKNADLSFLKMVTYGGGSMEVEDEIAINEFLKSHGCSVPLTKGHGMSEVSGCASYATLDYNDLGSMGIPMPKTIYGLVDPETKKPLRFSNKDKYLQGEFIISSPAATIGKLDDTEYVKHQIYDDMDFIMTGDLGRMYRDGKMEFLSRIDRAFDRYDGYKVKPFEIENVLKQDYRIKYCVISPYQDDEKLGNMIKATIVLEDGLDYSLKEKVELVKDLIDKYFVKNPNTSSRQIPAKFSFKENIPQTINGKDDYTKLAQEGLDGSEISVIIEETNLSVSNIEVIAPIRENLLQRKKK